MKFTLNWLKDHLDTSASLEEITTQLTSLGLELESVEDPAKAFAPFKVAYVEKAEKHPDADHGEGEVLDLEGHDLGGHGGSDVGPHDDPDGLFQGHEPRVDEAHRHDRGAAAALNEHGHKSADENPADGGFRQGADELPHLVSGEVLERLAHQLDSEKEKSYAAENLKRTAPRHNNIPRPFIVS